ncbi:hypothetical protein [Legionella sp. WA2022007384]
MPKIKGPRDGKIITASFDSKDNSKSRFPSLKTTKDLVLLSIKGNEYCAGEFLGAIVQQAVAMHQTGSEYTGIHGKATFLIADEIYWHNLEASFSGDDVDALKRKAIELGDLYLKANLAAFLAPLGLNPESFNNSYPCLTMDEKIQIINKLAAEKGKNFEIVRWRDWVSQNNFNEKLEQIMPLYSTVEGLKTTIDKTSAEFVSRHTLEADDPKIWLHRSQDYLTEESPSIMLLGADLGYNFIIYPGSILLPFQATKEYFVVEKHVARIEKGVNIKTECNHDKFCIHVEDPSRYVNWLEVNFKKSHENLPKNEAIAASKITFFSPTKIRTPKLPLRLLSSTAKEEEDSTELVAQKEVDSYSIMKGIHQALEKELLSKQKLNSNQSSTPLAQIFEGITQGLLTADMPMSEKMGMLAELIDNYINRPSPGYTSCQKLSIA